MHVKVPQCVQWHAWPLSGASCHLSPPVTHRRWSSNSCSLSYYSQHSYFILLMAMPRGFTVPNSMRETIVCMSADLRPAGICTYTDVSEWQQSQILKMWRETGTAIPHEVSWRGRPRNLLAEEVFVSALLADFPSSKSLAWRISDADSFLSAVVCHSCVNHTCDIYLMELQETLEAMCGTWPSLPTIWQTLQWAGYHMKKVFRHSLLMLLVLLTII